MSQTHNEKKIGFLKNNFINKYEKQSYMEKGGERQGFSSVGSLPKRLQWLRLRRAGV